MPSVWAGVSADSSLRYHFERAHHFVGGVLKKMAVPDVSAGIALETDDDASHGFGISLHCVLPPALARRWQHGSSPEVEVSGEEILIGVEALPVEDLKADQMQMDGMNVAGGVGEAPDLHGIELRALGDGLMPAGSVEEHEHALRCCVHVLAQDHEAGSDAGGLGYRLDGA